MAGYQSARLALATVMFSLLACEPVLPKAADTQETPAALAMRIADWQQNEARLAVAATTGMVNAASRYIDHQDEEHRANWQRHWISAHERYLAASILLPTEETLHGAIDSWPLQPGFIDSLPEYPESGIVTDLTLEMTPIMLREQHQITDDEEIATGFHVIEYYAFVRPGRDLAPDAPGSDRRRQLILLVGDLLLQDLRQFEAHLQAELPDPQVAVLPGLLTELHERSRLLFSEFNRLGTHGAASGRSSQAVLTQLKAIQSILAEPVGLNHHLLELNPALTGTLNSTLEEAIGLLPGEGSVGDADTARLLLLISALSYQLEDLVRETEKRGDSPTSS